MSTPRILHVVDKFGVSGSSICGVTRLFTAWVPRFRAAGLDTRVLCLKERSASAEVLEGAGVEVDYLGKPKGSPSTLPALIGRIRAAKPDIVHLHGYGAGLFGRVACVMIGLPAVLHEHFVDLSYPAYLGPVEGMLAPAAAWTIAVSRSVAEFCIAKRRLAPERVSVVQNGVVLDEFGAPDPAAAMRLRREFGIPLAAPVIGSIGRLHPYKGLEHLIDAMPAILPAHPEARAVIVGDGELRQELEARARGLGVGERILFTGFRQEIPAFLSLFDVMAIPSISEGMPLTALEAMSQGKPIVATPVGGLGEIFVDRQTALQVPPSDPAALARGLNEVLGDEALRAGLGERCRIQAREFDIGRTVDRIGTIYEKVLSRT